MTLSNQSYILLITSFHRSGSSMVGKILSDSGLFIGDNLLQGERSNPDGHFEDLDIMQLHERILKKCHSSWQYSGSECLGFDSDDMSEVTDLVARRNQQHLLWGFKDPRSSLFLNDWSTILAENGRYLLLYRHYSQCIASLYRRHSRSLCLNQLDNSANPSTLMDLNFWTNANLAAKMWLSYNERLLEFATKNSDKVLLVSQPAILSGYPLIEALNKKFAFNLHSHSDNLIQHDYTHNDIKKAQISGISDLLYEKMDSVWNALNAIADAPCDAPNLINTQAVNFPEKIQGLITVFNTEDYSAPVEQNDKDNMPLASLAIEEQIKQYAQNNECQLALDLLPDLIKIDPLKPEYWILAGNVQMRNAHFEHAQHSYSYAIALNPAVPYFYMHLGLAFLEQDKRIEAEYFLQQALNKNPKNPSFFFQLGKYHAKYRQFEQAQGFFKQALAFMPNNAQFINEYSHCLIEMEGTEEALSFLKAHCNQHSPLVVMRKYAALLLQSGYAQEALFWYNTHDVAMLKNTNLTAWLADILAQIPDNEMCENFQYWLYYHWNSLDKNKNNLA